MKRKLQAILVFAIILSVFALLLTGCNQTGEDGKFTVTFDSMDGSAQRVVSVNEGEVLSAPAKPTRSGYLFTGWYIERECETLWQFDTDTVNENLTLYAGWEEEITDVDVTAVTGGTVTEDAIQIVVADTVAELNMSDLVTLSSKGASWKLLNERQDKEFPDKTATDLKDGSNKFTMMVFNSRGNQANLYSLEIYKKYKVTVEVLGVNSVPMPQYEYSVTVLDPLPEPTGVEIEGYTVNGFNCNYDFGKPLPKTAPHKIIVTAKLTGKTYHVTLNANGGTIGGESQKTVTATYGGYPALGTPERSGWAFDGWYAGETEVPIESRTGKTASPWSYAEDKTLTAKWTVYTLTTNVNNADLGTCTQKDGDAVIPGSTVKLTATTKKYGVWIGWFEGDELLSKNTTYSCTMPEKDVVLTAKFGQLKFSSNGFYTGGYIKDYDPYQKNYTYTDGQKVDYTAVTKNGYIFTGWFDENDEKVGDALQVTLTANGENKIYAPKWVQVTLAKNIEEAGKVSELKETYVAGDEFTAKAVTNLGYNFLGWFDGEEKVSDDLEFDFLLPAENKTYTAKWSFYTVKVNASPEDGGKASMSFTVNFDVNGGDETSTPAPQVAGPGESWRYPALPTRSGYVLKGWYTEPECENIYDFSKATPVHNITLYAGWEQMVTSGYSKRVAIDTRDYYGAMTGFQEKSYTQETSYISTSQNTKYSYTYFTAYRDTTIWFAYRANVNDVSRNSSVYLDIYNVTQDKAIVTDENLKDTFKGKEALTMEHRFDVKTGDVLYFRTSVFGNYPFYIRMTFEWNDAVTGPVSVDEAKISVGEEITLSAITKDGYNFLGWYDGDEQVSSQSNYTFIMTAENREYTAKWTKGVILEKNIEEAGTVTVNNAVADVGEQITLTATTKTGYTFLGWYENESLIGNHAHEITVTVTGESKTYTAKWIKVTLEKDLEEGGTITVGLNSTYVVGDRVTVTAVTNIGYIWKGWYEGNGQVCTDLSYAFDMPDADITLVATWELCTEHAPNSDCICSKCGKIAHTSVNCVCTECGHVDHSAAIETNGYCRHTDTASGKDYIYMGYYPQSVKADHVTVSATADADGYYGGSDGERYAKRNSSRKYGSGFYFNNGSVIQEETYYFKVEPVKWRILKEENGSAMIMTDVLIDEVGYAGYRLVGNNYYTTNPDAPKNTYANNYQYSSVRKWLNGQFYAQAFTEASKNAIQTTAVDNSGTSMGEPTSPFWSPTTNDKVFLLSYAEVTDRAFGFSGETVMQDERKLLTSDYSRVSPITANYQTNCAEWMLRSPHSHDLGIWTVNSAGKVDQKYIKEALGIAPVVVIAVA